MKSIDRHGFPSNNKHSNKATMVCTGEHQNIAFTREMLFSNNAYPLTFGLNKLIPTYTDDVFIKGVPVLRYVTNIGNISSVIRTISLFVMKVAYLNLRLVGQLALNLECCLILMCINRRICICVHDLVFHFQLWLTGCSGVIFEGQNTAIACSNTYTSLHSIRQRND